MARLTNMLLVAAALAATTTGCTKKHPAELPPVAGPAPQEPATGSDIRPGSRADFERTVLSNTIHFALARYDIDPQSQRILDSQVQWLRQWPNVPVSLEGHCDERGTRGINPGRISTSSYGKERPIALGSDEASWAQNRRAVTIVLN